MLDLLVSPPKAPQPLARTASAGLLTAPAQLGSCLHTDTYGVRSSCPFNPPVFSRLFPCLASRRHQVWRHGFLATPAMTWANGTEIVMCTGRGASESMAIVGFPLSCPAVRVAYCRDVVAGLNQARRCEPKPNATCSSFAFWGREESRIAADCRPWALVPCQAARGP